MNNNKIFSLANKEDFGFYLFYLITKIYPRLERHNRYIEELEKIIEDNTSKYFISACIYEDIYDKIFNNEKILLNLFGDLSKAGMSYYKFRILLDKKIKSNNQKFKDYKLTEDKIINYLKDLNSLRNWTLHVPESLMVSCYNQLKENKHTLQPFQFRNEEKLSLVTKYSIEILKELLDGVKEKNNIMKIIFENMKENYSELANKKVIFIENSIETIYSSRSPDLKVIYDSWKIQTGKSI